MIKKCMGCGITLQDKDPKKIGYVPDMKKKVCLRCFKIKNYGYKTITKLNIDNNKIIKKINNSKNLTFYLIDFLNITKENLNSFKKINNPKVLVINKIDLLPKNINFLKIKKLLKEYYKILDEIIFISGKTKQSTNKILKIMDEKNMTKAILAGYTNSGKSTLINTLTGNELTTSYLPNTTLDFIKIYLDEEHTLLDTPGLIYQNNLLNLVDYEELKVMESKIKEISYQTKKDAIINILDKISIKTNIDNNIIVYLSDKIKIEKVFKDTLNLDKEVINILDNQDVIIRGVCLINIKKKSRLEIGVADKNLIEIRPSMFS